MENLEHIDEFVDKDFYLKCLKFRKKLEDIFESKAFQRDDGSELKGATLVLDIDNGGGIGKIEKRIFSYPHTIKRY